jgi:hypothetical protein
MTIPSLVQWSNGLCQTKSSEGQGAVSAHGVDLGAIGAVDSSPNGELSMVFQSTLDDFLTSGWSSSAPMSRPEDGVASEAPCSARGLSEGIPGSQESIEEWVPPDYALYVGPPVTLPFPPPAEGAEAQPDGGGLGVQREILGSNIEAALSSPLPPFTWPAPMSVPAPTSVAGAASSIPLPGLRDGSQGAKAEFVGGARFAPRASRSAEPVGGARFAPRASRSPELVDPLPRFVTQILTETVPLAATPKGMRAATPEDRVRDVGAAEVDEALRRVVHREQPSIPPALRSEFPAPMSGASRPDRREGGESVGAPELVPSLDQQVSEPRGGFDAAVPLAPATDSPLRDAVVRFTEEPTARPEGREVREARQADVERAVDAMTLSRKMVATAVLEGGERVRIEAVPEERSVALDVRIDNRDAAELLTLVRGDLMAQLEGSAVARVSVGFQTFDTSAGGQDRQGGGGHPSAGRQEEGSPSPAQHAKSSSPTTPGRVRVVL